MEVNGESHRGKKKKLKKHKKYGTSILKGGKSRTKARAKILKTGKTKRKEALSDEKSRQKKSTRKQRRKQREYK